MRIMKFIILVFVLLGFGVNTSFAQETVVKKGIKVKPELNMHGRIQYDFEFLNQKSGVEGVDDYSFKGNEFRRVYLSASGKIYKNIKYKAQFEFAGGEIAYRDVYIKFTKLPYIGGDLAFGSVAEATGLDMSTSSKYIPFIERAMMTSTQNFRWNSGIHYSNFGLLGGKLGLQMSYAFNASHKSGFKEEDLGKGAHFVARLTSPIYMNKEKHQLVHIGVNYENRTRSEEAADYALKFRPENHMGHSTKVAIAGLENQNDIGFELAANFGSVSFQGEYEIANYVTAEETYSVNGYYAALTYFVFGGNRAFKKGAYSRVKPTSNFCIKDGGLGAIELVARYSTMDYSSVVTGGLGDKVNNVTLGFNWYLNSHSRLMYNYIITNYNGGENVNNLNANLIRLQVDF